MYPLNMKKADGIGFAVANDEKEHRALTKNGYGPAYEAPTKKSAKDADNGPAGTDKAAAGTGE